MHDCTLDGHLTLLRASFMENIHSIIFKAWFKWDYCFINLNALPTTGKIRITTNFSYPQVNYNVTDVILVKQIFFPFQTYKNSCFFRDMFKRLSNICNWDFLWKLLTIFRCFYKKAPSQCFYSSFTYSLTKYLQWTGTSNFSVPWN